MSGSQQVLGERLPPPRDLRGWQDPLVRLPVSGAPVLIISREYHEDVYPCLAVLRTPSAADACWDVGLQQLPVHKYYWWAAYPEHPSAAEATQHCVACGAQYSRRRCGCQGLSSYMEYCRDPGRYVEASWEDTMWGRLRKSRDNIRRFLRDERGRR